MMITRLVGPAMLLAAAAGAAPLRAQGADTTRVDTARVTPVVVTATRVPIDAAASPATVTVIAGSALRARGVTSLADALADVPGIVVAQSGSFGATTSLFLRGGESKYVKVLVDGVPANDPGGAIDLSTLTTDNVERIEIVRGPASVLYGADAVTGVVQIFTRRGHGAPRVSLSARGGSYGSGDADASVTGAGGAADYSLDVARHDTRGIYAFNNAYHNTVASGALHVAIDPRTALRVSLRVSDDVFHYPTDGSGDVVDTNAHQTGDRTMLSAELTRALARRVDAVLALTSDETTGATDDPPDSPSAAGLESVDDTRRRGGDLRANVHLPALTTLTLGAAADQEDERSESQSVFGAFSSTSIFHASRRNAAGYAQLLSTVASTVVVTAGARVDDNEQFGKFGTYRVGANWQVRDGTRFRASAGTAFREPTFFENYATGYVTGNPRLEPERALSWEAGLTQSLLGDRASIGITQFDQQFRNMIDYTGDTTACGASYCNVARARASGRELEVQVAPVPALHLDANLTHLETRVLTPGFDTTSGGLYHQGQALIRRPTTTWDLGAAWSSARGTADVRVMHVGARGDRDFRPYPAVPVVDPAYTRTDLGGALPLGQFARAWQPAAATVHVENLFDVRYQSIFNFLSPRRTVLVGVRLTW